MNTTKLIKREYNDFFFTLMLQRQAQTVIKDTLKRSEMIGFGILWEYKTYLVSILPVIGILILGLLR